MKKKILMLGNHEIVIYNFRKELVQKMIDEGYEVIISLPYGPKVEFLKQMGCSFIDTPINRRNTNPIEDIKLFLAYMKIVKAVKPDVVFTYTIKPNIYGGLACRLKKIPYIVNVTGLGSSFINGGLLHHIVSNLSRLSFIKAKKVFFQNTADRDLLISKKIVKDNYDLLPGSGVNLNQYLVLPYPSKEDPIVFNFIARVMKDKGIDEYLEAATIIKQKYSNVVFNVIGMIDQPVYEEILNDYQEKGIIIYQGFQTNLIPFIEQSSCTINPSYTEGMSNVLLESAACGRPIIASNIPGCKEIVEEGINGYTFEVKNVPSLVEAIENFIHLEHKTKINMGLLGRKKVEQEFNREIVVNKYILEIESVEKRKCRNWNIKKLLKVKS